MTDELDLVFEKFTNSISEIASVAHHPAVFFTQSGTFSANAFGMINPKTKSASSEAVIYFIKFTTI